jgi:hypothetical protein
LALVISINAGRRVPVQIEQQAGACQEDHVMRRGVSTALVAMCAWGIWGTPTADAAQRRTPDRREDVGDRREDRRDRRENMRDRRENRRDARADRGWRDRREDVWDRRENRRDRREDRRDTREDRRDRRR